MRLKNKIALITGSASGIGQSCAEIFAHEGTTVIISDIDDSKGQQQLARKIGENALYQHLDVLMVVFLLVQQLH
ncbi:MAG: 3(or 17)beta-hydroxysteroid dehydrogenase [Pseudomonadota bacterium]|nr:3(or 17)beta-hydroxysteroid dehydrogenase [Pseudomonadota bacterium]